MAQPSLFGEEPPKRFGVMEVRQIGAKSILNAATGRLSVFDFSLNPYVGCGFACSYCYAAFFVPDEKRAAAWGTWVDIKENALELLRRSTGLAGAKLYIGSVTDPYQPLERKTGLTRSLLEFMIDVRPQPSIVIQTRSDLPLRDVDILRRFENLRVNISLTTDDDSVRKRFEPSCLSVERRLAGLRKLKEAGIATGACLCPLLPVTNPRVFAARLKEVKADRYSVSTFHSNDGGRFAAGTRKLALELAQEFGWDDAAYRKTVAALQRAFPAISETGIAFRPTWEGVRPT